MRRSYILTLTLQRDQARRQVEAANAGIALLESYMLSEKFHQDPTVQTNDILLRLNEIKRAMTDAEFETPEPQPKPKKIVKSCHLCGGNVIEDRSSDRKFGVTRKFDSCELCNTIQ